MRTINHHALSTMAPLMPATGGPHHRRRFARSRVLLRNSEPPAGLDIPSSREWQWRKTPLQFILSARWIFCAEEAASPSRGVPASGRLPTPAGGGMGCLRQHTDLPPLSARLRVGYARAQPHP